jgi:hypothetical protein
MNDPRLINSLKIAWPSIDRDYPYAVAILKQLGRSPEFPNFPNYLRLWAWVNAGELIGRDISHWEPMLKAETERLTKIQTEYELSYAETAAKQTELQARLESLNAQLNPG